MAGFGTVENPYVENPFAGRIVNVHWPSKKPKPPAVTATVSATFFTPVPGSPDEWLKLNIDPPDEATGGAGSFVSGGIRFLSVPGGGTYALEIEATLEIDTASTESGIGLRAIGYIGGGRGGVVGELTNLSLSVAAPGGSASDTRSVGGNNPALTGEALQLGMEIYFDPMVSRGRVFGRVRLTRFPPPPDP